MEIMKIPKKYTSFCNAVSVIYKQEGMRGFFKGLYTTVVLIPLNYMIYFNCYEASKKIARKHLGDKNGFLCFAIPSIVSGFITNFALCPLWVLKTRIQSDIYRGVHKSSYFLFKTVWKIYKTVTLYVAKIGRIKSII